MSRKIYIIIAVVFTVVLSVSTFFIIRNHIDSAKQNEVYDNLAEIVEDEPPKENEGVTFSEDKDYLAEYLELYRQNEDMVGWIKVEDTNINYPVVQSVNEPNFYLKHKFDKTYSAGSLFHFRQVLCQFAPRQEIVVKDSVMFLQKISPHLSVSAQSHFRLLWKFQVRKAVIAHHRVGQFVHCPNSFRRYFQPYCIHFCPDRQLCDFDG